MKKLNFLLVAGFSIFLSCASKDGLPEKPKDKEKYKDTQGNSWIYNAMLMRWALTPSGGGNASYYYYPGNSSWTNSNGIKVDPPANIKASTYMTPSVKPNSSKSGIVNKSTSKPSSGKSFGSSYKPSSFGG